MKQSSPIDAIPADRHVADGRHMLGLDGLRGFAAWVVVVAHLTYWGFPKLADEQIGVYGVFLFFALSGFLMGHLYLRNPLTRDGAVLYLAARIARILPLYYATLVIGFLYGRFVDPHFTFAMSDVAFVRHLAFVGTAPVFWSIGPEVQFYGLFVILWWVVSQPQPKVMSYGVIALALCLVVIFLRDIWPGILVLSKLHIFLAGIALAFIRARLAPMMTAQAAAIAQGIALVFLLALFLPGGVIGSALYPDYASDPKLNAYYRDFGKLLPLLFVIGAFSFTTRLSDTVFGNWIATRSGGYSFSIYLLHIPVLYALEQMGVTRALPPALAVMVAVVTIGLVAAASFHLLEDPSRKYLRGHLIRWMGGRVSRRPLSA